MAKVEEIRIKPSELAYRVLQRSPDSATAPAAAAAVHRYLQRKRAGLAAALEIEPAGRHVILRARGEVPHEMLREAMQLLESARPPEPTAEIEVDAEQFAVSVDEKVLGDSWEREIIRSTVRYFPHPVCEWFEISTGELTLTDKQIVYEPEWQIMQDEAAREFGKHVIPLGEVLGVSRGEWWDVPCLMVAAPGITYRYGWPAERGDLELIFDVDEWLDNLRKLVQDP